MTLLKIEELRKRNLARRKFYSYYPETGPLRRELYPKHMQFFAAGAEHNERLFLAANRVGKTEGTGCYEMACHLTGIYPEWWKGRRFDHPIQAWAAGKNNKTTRDILQFKLFGPIAFDGGSKTVNGTGVVLGETIGNITWQSGIADFIDVARVRHISGGWSELGLKSYEQGRGAFEGTERHVVYFDEEPPLDIYTEGLMRTMTVNGIVFVTFTPLCGMSETVLAFLPGGKLPGEMKI